VSGAKEETASRKVRPYHEKNQPPSALRPPPATPGYWLRLTHTDLAFRAERRMVPFLFFDWFRAQSYPWCL
jgi:hypothetical protein